MDATAKVRCPPRPPRPDCKLARAALRQTPVVRAAVAIVLIVGVGLGPDLVCCGDAPVAITVF